MDNLTCSMCGSPDVKLEGNYYICNSCGSKYKSYDFNNSSSNERTLTEEEKAELERLKTYLEKDHSLAKRILELEPNNWLAYRIEYSVNDRWFELLRDSGMTQKEIEKALTIHYYESEKSFFSKLLGNCSYDGKIFDSDIDDFFQALNSACLHILSVLGDEYSELTKSWQEDAEKFIDECKEIVKRNWEEEKEKENRKDRRAGNVMLIIGIILAVIVVIVCILVNDDAVWMSLGITGGLIAFSLILVGFGIRS